MYKTLPQNSCMTAPFKGSIRTEPKPEIDIAHYSRKWIPSRNLCAALCTVKKDDNKTAKTTNDTKLVVVQFTIAD